MADGVSPDLSNLHGAVEAGNLAEMPALAPKIETPESPRTATTIRQPLEILEAQALGPKVDSLLLEAARLMLDVRDLRCLPAMLALQLNHEPLAMQIKRDILDGLANRAPGKTLMGFGEVTTALLTSLHRGKFDAFRGRVAQLPEYARPADGGPIVAFLQDKGAPQELIQQAQKGIGENPQLLLELFQKANIAEPLWNSIRKAGTPQSPRLEPQELLSGVGFLKNEKDVKKFYRLMENHRPMMDHVKGFFDINKLSFGLMLGMFFVQMIQESDRPGSSGGPSRMGH